MGVKNANVFESRVEKCGSFDHNTRDAGSRCGESAGEHPAALDTVINRKLACCHFERSGSSAVARLRRRRKRSRKISFYAESRRLRIRSQRDGGWRDSEMSRQARHDKVPSYSITASTHAPPKHILHQLPTAQPAQVLAKPVHGRRSRRARPSIGVHLSATWRAACLAGAPWRRRELRDAAGFASASIAFPPGQVPDFVLKTGAGMRVPDSVARGMCGMEVRKPLSNTYMTAHSLSDSISPSLAPLVN